MKVAHCPFHSRNLDTDVNFCVLKNFEPSIAITEVFRMKGFLERIHLLGIYEISKLYYAPSLNNISTLRESCRSLATYDLWLKAES